METAAETDDGETEDKTRYYLVYYVVSDESVVEGEYITEFEINEDGSLSMLSTMWFGATTPHYTNEDESVTWPVFVLSSEEIIADIDASAIVSKSSSGASDSEEDDSETDGEFQTGTYGGTYTTTAMGGSLTYATSITFNADGTYTYTVKFSVQGNTYTETETGTYVVSGSKITLTSGDGTTMSGSWSGKTVTITRYASSYASSKATLTFTYGYVGSATSSSTETEKESEKQTQTETETETEKVVNADNGLAGGKYVVDMSWSAMAGWFTPMIEIDASNMTFYLYNDGSYSSSKGSGTITYTDGVFTLNYMDEDHAGQSTTFTFSGDTITFTSVLYYGAATIQNTDDAGLFTIFTATRQTSGITETESESESETETETQKESEDQTETETETETELPGETDPSSSSVTAGVYSGSTEVTSMMGTVTYNYTLTLNEDGTYTYVVSYSTMGTTIEETETGTWESDSNAITLTIETDAIYMGGEYYGAGSKFTAGATLSGTVNSDKTFTINRNASNFAGSAVDLTFTAGSSSDGGQTEAETDSEEATETESETETETDSETEDETESGDTANLSSGTYAVDISWSAMANYFTPMLEIDAENMIFYIYNDGVYDTSKGEGTITYVDEVYTLNYSSEYTTAFTYANGVITFTSPLYYGAARFNNVDDDGNFVTYTAALTESSGETESESETETETETESEENTVTLKTGTYSGTKESSSMMGTVTYSYTLTLNSDGTYTYYVTYSSMGSLVEETETGTWEISGTSITLTTGSDAIYMDNLYYGVGSKFSVDATMSGTVNSDGTLIINRYVTNFAGSVSDLTFTQGSSAVTLQAANEIGSDSGSESESETEVESETKTETETELETETEAEDETEADSESETESESETGSEATAGEEAETETGSET
ncbi:MAG: copper resistance protein NlpE [Lachnospiraceae bacterium]|nr:copper resistance protein NlpE [Lachnospiraceae bacterium]